ncbi:MAG: transposase [Lachnospiraceae bacterium]
MNELSQIHSCKVITMETDKDHIHLLLEYKKRRSSHHLKGNGFPASMNL